MYILIGKIIADILIPYLLYVLFILAKKGLPPKHLYWIFDIGEEEINSAEGLFEMEKESIFETIKITFIFILVLTIITPITWGIVTVLWPVIILLLLIIFLVYKFKKK